MSLGGASPLSPTIFVELKPQQTGTRLLIGYGEVATTSGSTTFLPGRLIAGHRPLKASVVVRSPAANYDLRFTIHEQAFEWGHPA